MMHEPWRVQLLGGLRLQQHLTTVERFRTRKAAELLAYLAFYAHRQHSREALAELLWPDVAFDARAKLHNLSQTLSTLRRYLEPTPADKATVLRATHTHIFFNREAIVVDAAEFEAAVNLASRAAEDGARHLAQAISLYAGEFLPGVYEEWALRERERLSGLFVQSLLQLSAHVGGQGQWEQAISHALRAARIDPYNETAHEAVIHGQIASGQPQRAFAHYREFEAYIGDDIHSPAFADLRALIQRMANANAPTLPFPVSLSPPLPPLSTSPPPEPIAPLHETVQTVVPATQLPLTLTAFFGREAEIQQASHILETARLLTLTGPGGSGKTRLAIEIARNSSPHFNTVVFVGLADIAQPLDLLPTIADALVSTLHPQKASSSPASDASQNALTQIAALVSNRHALLLLDNFEHLLEGAQTVTELLAACPRLSCLATSRRPLALSGERVLAVTPFDCPDDTLNLDELQTRPSIQLFLNRAQAVRSDFRLTAQNAPLLAGLCADLDGLPLALELAAARIGTFALSEMRQQLADGKKRFQLLVSRHRDTHHRHHSLTAALGWSYCQLPPAQQAFFARLSLLHGNWTADAAYAVGGIGDKQDANDALEQLCLASLIVANTGDCKTDEPAKTTYHLLETMRQFGQQQLTPEELQEAALQHARFYLQLAETHSSGRETNTESVWLAAMEQSAPNLRAALDWCFGPEGDSAIGVRMCIALTRFWYYRCHFVEASRYFTLALNVEECLKNGALRADALHGAALFASRLNHYRDAATWAQECLQLRREGSDTDKTAHCLQNLAHYVWCLHDLNASEAYHREALALYETLQDLEGIGRAYGGLGEIALNQGHAEEAESWRMQYLSVARQAGNQAAVAVALGSLADLALSQEQWARAKMLAEEALTMHQAHGDAYKVAYACIGLARAYLGLNEWKEAETRLQAALATLERLADRSGLAGIHRLWAELDWQQGKPEAARLHLQQCFTLLLQIKEPLSVGKAAEQWLTQTLTISNANRCLPLLAALDRQRADGPFRRLPAEQREWNACIEKAKTTMGVDAFQRAWDKGRAMDWNKVLATFSPYNLFSIGNLFPAPHLQLLGNRG